MVVNGHRYPLDADHIVRFGPTAPRKLLDGRGGRREFLGERIVQIPCAPQSQSISTRLGADTTCSATRGRAIFKVIEVETADDRCIAIDEREEDTDTGCLLIETRTVVFGEGLVELITAIGH